MEDPSEHEHPTPRPPADLTSLTLHGYTSRSVEDQARIERESLSLWRLLKAVLVRDYLLRRLQTRATVADGVLRALLPLSAAGGVLSEIDAVAYTGAMLSALLATVPVVAGQRGLATARDELHQIQLSIHALMSALRDDEFSNLTKAEAKRLDLRASFERVRRRTNDVIPVLQLLVFAGQRVTRSARRDADQHIEEDYE